MPTTCCVKNCHSRSNDQQGNKTGVRFFRFPLWKRMYGEQVAEVTKRRRMAWVAAMRRRDITFDNISKSMRVCSQHFHSGEPSYEMLENHPDWKPSLLLGHDDVQMTDEARFQRSLKRKVVAEDLYAEPLQVQPKNLDAELPHPEELDAEPPQVQPEDMDAEPLQELPEDLDAEQPVMTSAECEFCTSRQALIVSLLEENRHLKEELEEYRMDERFLRGDDEKVKYYTGLPNFAIFQAMLLNILPYIHQGKRKLTAFQCVLLTLMRLRLDLPFQHLSHLFQVHRTTVGVAFQQTIEVLYARLSLIVHWPSRDCLMVSMPHQFIESFGKHVAAIVDCF
ncbi:hypothetical protein AALO_G00113970 [Alosa alosa]|uniref:THAP-type domain-containing protein n=1 Tax=Alosa alosa TaxID=278164 RepID=A0AAV6GQT2_9TELE|nr:uncharacterized protein LOC125299610 [Alosa alosa]KAG5277139.1 hypothetical protein AALO_G00113970 [Alosa alosa]